MDLTKFWFAQEDTKIRAYVFDYHRPINHCNVNSEKKIIMIDDGHFNIEECPLDEDVGVQLNEDELEDFEDDKDDIEEEEEREYNQDDDDMEIQIEKERDEDVEGEIIDFGKKRKERARLRRMAEKRIKFEKMQRTRSYYRGDYFGKSIAGIMYFIAQQLNKESLDYLWFGKF